MNIFIQSLFSLIFLRTRFAKFTIRALETKRADANMSALSAEAVENFSIW